MYIVPEGESAFAAKLNLWYRERAMEAAGLGRIQAVALEDAVVQSTVKALQIFGSHNLEGLVLWLGLVQPERARVIHAFVPEQQSIADESGVGYFVNGETLFKLNKKLAETGLRLIAQVHSHPREAYHSAGPPNVGRFKGHRRRPEPFDPDTARLFRGNRPGIGPYRGLRGHLLLGAAAHR